MRDIPGFDPTQAKMSPLEVPANRPREKINEDWYNQIKAAFRQLKIKNTHYQSDTTVGSFIGVGEPTVRDDLLFVPIDISLNNPRVFAAEKHDDRFHLIINPESGQITTDIDYREFPTRLQSQIPLYQKMEADLINMIKTQTSYDGNRH